MYYGVTARGTKQQQQVSTGPSTNVDLVGDGGDCNRTSDTEKKSDDGADHSPSFHSIESQQPCLILGIGELVGAYCLSLCLLLLSWKLLYVKVVLVNTQFALIHWALTFLSLALCCASYLLVVYSLVLRKDLSPMVSRDMCSDCICCIPVGVRRRKWAGLGNVRQRLPALRPSQLPRPWLTKMERRAMAFPVVVFALVLVGVQCAVPAKFAQTREIAVATARCVYDAIYYLTATLLLIAHVTNMLADLALQGFQSVMQRWLPEQSPQRAGSSRVAWEKRRSFFSYSHLPGVIAVLVVIATIVRLLVASPVSYAWHLDAAEEMKGTILETSTDFCVAEGGQLSARKLRHAWILPKLLPRRFFNFYMGDERCTPKTTHSRRATVPLAYLSAGRETLVVPKFCPGANPGAFADGSERTRVFLERPRLSEMQPSKHRPSTLSPGPTLSADQLQRELELKYGKGIGSNESDVVLHRNGRGYIMEVELRLDSLTPRRRREAPLSESPEEKLLVERWGLAGSMFFEIPLGRSPTITVRCDSLDREDMFFFPVKQEVEADASQLLPSPPHNVLVLMFDAVSRPEVLRSLPNFVSWTRDFKARSTTVGFRVVEGQGHTTFGFSTGGNFAPSLAGTSAFVEGGDRETYPNVSFFEKSLFSLAKRKFGNKLQTSLSMGYCHNVLHGVFGVANASTGNGGSPLYGLDRYFYGPMCRKQYSAQESNVRGPYSIRQRCLGRQHVHEVLLSYTKSLLTHHLSAQETFFDLSYFIEGHEGSHSVLSHVDMALVDFMLDLEHELGFFKDPKNVLVMYADHGSHMGPYYLSSEAGRMERTMPFLLFFLHSSVFVDIDLSKRKPIGASEYYFRQRTSRLTTPMDLFLTLGDLLGLQESANVAPSFATAPWPPRSMFEPLDPSADHVKVSSKLPASSKKEKRPRVSSDDLVNTSARKLESFPLATYWCDF